MSPDKIPRVIECRTPAEVARRALRLWRRGCSVQVVGLLVMWWPS